VPLRIYSITNSFAPPSTDHATVHRRHSPSVNPVLLRCRQGCVNQCVILLLLIHSTTLSANLLVPLTNHAA